jgi:hypothetical protein
MIQSGQVGMTLVVDVDGTLIKSDLLLESALKFVKQSPLSILWMLRWLLFGGKARLKSRIAEQVDLDIGHMPFRGEIVALCRQAHQQGRRVVLATGAAMKYAQQIALLLRMDGVRSMWRSGVVPAAPWSAATRAWPPLRQKLLPCRCMSDRVASVWACWRGPCACTNGRRTCSFFCRFCRSSAALS